MSRRGRAVTGGGGRKTGNTTVAITAVGCNAMDRPRLYPSRRPKVSVFLSWPPNCGRRRDLGDNGGGAPTVGIIEEKEVEPVEEEPKEENHSKLERENADIDATK
ncbi:unnamed protein product [Linum trigynum]|uniref:Uncharacterized protein n=1 Tax=Linum trigynum TaxID=586398 RepID=A0AAV2FBJ9_9ROSI